MASDIIQEAALHRKKVVWNLSGIDIPPETEELLGRLGMNFQFAPKEFPALEIIQSTELVCQKIENYKTNDQKLVAMNKERAQKIRNVVVSHVQRNHKENQTKYNSTSRTIIERFHEYP